VIAPMHFSDMQIVKVNFSTQCTCSVCCLHSVY